MTREIDLLHCCFTKTRRRQFLFRHGLQMLLNIQPAFKIRFGVNVQYAFDSSSVLKYTWKEGFLAVSDTSHFLTELDTADHLDNSAVYERKSSVKKALILSNKLRST